MPYRSKSRFTSQKRKFKSRTYRKRFKNRNVKFSSRYNLPIHYMKRKCNIGTINTNLAGYGTTSLTFQLSDLPGVTDFSNLFSQYCLRYVKVYIVQRYNSVEINGTNYQLGMPNIISVKDYNNQVTVPTADEAGYNILRECSSSRTFSYTPENRVCTIGLVPAVLSEAYNSGLSSTYTSKFKQFISMGLTSTPHWGVKIVVQVPSATALATPICTFDVYATYYLAFKTVR